MDVYMPPSFLLDDFRAFASTASSLFGKLFSDRNLFDRQEKKRNFDWACQAVRYRYRTCAECAEEFKGLLANPSASWSSGWGDEELNYKLEHCIYEFFTNGLSVFESFGFCLYFLGFALQPDDFPHVATPKKITLDATSKAFCAAFPATAITACLLELLQKPEFTIIDRIRNLLAHRVSGRRSVRAWNNGTASTQEETWHIPGLPDPPQFSENMLHRQLDNTTGMLTSLTASARVFAESQKPQFR
jgi:hypothetical protein